MDLKNNRSRAVEEYQRQDARNRNPGPLLDVELMSDSESQMEVETEEGTDVQVRVKVLYITRPAYRSSEVRNSLPYFDRTVTC